MRTHQASTTPSAKAASLTPPATRTLNANGPLAASDYSAFAAKRKRTVAALIDDQDALAEWHRNMARLRTDHTG